MTPQIRTYILAVGRDMEDKPVRKVARYDGLPLKGMGDHYHLMTAPQLNEAQLRVEDVMVRAQQAWDDIHAEKIDRLERLTNRTTNADIREAIRNA